MRATLALLVAMSSCGGTKLPTRWLEVEGHRVFVEVADDEERRARGLMNRDKLGSNSGMLFVYPNEAPRGFWMKNTRIPLSIAYIDKSGGIVSIHDMRPMSSRSVPSDGPAMYALEVNQGWFAERSIAAGAQVKGLPGPSKH
ncbi:MAG: DUF192 domain-containing protein [Deltaproteobacteria bacterium]|nr:MAG: DUF192 domain-containing protein [Deltaproteobacteria bacterium]